ncbi:hypothetical protein PchlO6_2142 [Pseudomonas chlororaphis O6]|uniref:Uncharacterized protein n=1 Tax=Pseudomonas chlororaphis O6 TaxID=1037915 RepID=A0AB33WLQ7_9PSED|nr:hypothetical protein PchlO6_2142 [Pseudomonas chlororaphis O6]
MLHCGSLLSCKTQSIPASSHHFKLKVSHEQANATSIIA